MRDLKVFALSFELDILGLGTSTEKTRLTKDQMEAGLAFSHSKTESLTKSAVVFGLNVELSGYVWLWGAGECVTSWPTSFWRHLESAGMWNPRSSALACL